MLVVAESDMEGVIEAMPPARGDADACDSGVRVSNGGEAMACDDIDELNVSC